MRYLLLLFVFYGFSFCRAQDKTEREYRIDISLVPIKAQDFVAHFEPTKRLKWLQEEGENSTSIEAKFKKKGRRHSIEFTTEGHLEDLEIVVAFSQIPKRVRNQIRNTLKNTFEYYKIEKTQEQYSQAPDQILQWLEASAENRILPPKYEIVVKTRNSGEKSRRFQYLFNETGQEVQRSRIAIRSDNILRF